MGVSPEQPTGLRSPYLFFKIGAIGCAPIGFEQAAADELSAVYLSKSSVARRLKDHKTGAGKTTRTLGSVDHLLNKETIVNLQAGKSVLIDKFFNSVGTRNKLRRLADLGHASLVALNIDTPTESMEGTLAEIMEQHPSRDTFTEVGHDPLKIYKPTLDQLTRPSATEPIDLVINLSGDQDNQVLIGQIRTALATAQ
jgi:hypothetical protein